MLRRRDALGALGALAARSGPVRSAEAAPPRQRPLREGLGLNVKFGQGQPLSQLGLLKDLGVRWVRDALAWRQIEPRAGQWVAGPPAWRQRLAYYREHDIGVVFVLGLANEQAWPPTAEQPLRHVDPQAFAAQALQVARMLRAAGVRFVLEVGNEPHSGLLPKLLGGHWSGRAPAPWLDHYVAMVQAAVRAVKDFDPAIRVLCDDDLWVVHHRYLDAGLPAALDGFALHPYSNVGPERIPSQDTDWVRPYRLSDEDRSVGSAVRHLREAGARKLGHVPQIWFTEWGCPVGDKGPQFVSAELQAARLPRAFILAEAAGVEALCWFSAHDAGEGSFGLLDNAHRPRPAFQAFRTLHAELGDWQLERQVLGRAQPTRGLQGHLFRQGSQRKLAIWQADETVQPLALKGPLQGASAVVDALGQVQDAAGPLRVGALPLYLLLDAAAAATAEGDWGPHVR